jgi:hypothetical protein
MNKVIMTDANKEKFWAEDPCVLVTDLRFVPTANMNRDEKLNALARLSIIICIAMYFLHYKYWFTFLVLAFLVILLLKYVKKGNEDSKEGFTLTPTYTGLELDQTTVAPTFAEEWQVYPPTYDIYENYPPSVTFQEPLKPQNYPYGQYLTRTNTLPSDEFAMHMLNGSPRNAREYANSAFLRNTLAFRDNMTRLYKKKLARRFRQNCTDTFSPYHSY